MKHILFRTSPLALIALFTLANSSMAQDKPKPSPREHYELRVYTVDSATQQQRIANYWAEAAIPALNRQGIKNIGLFQETKPQEGEQFGQVIVLVPYKTIGQFASSVSKLNADKEYKKVGADYLNATKDDPAYRRIESHLLRAMRVKPQLTVPDTGKKRIFEMREYEGHSEAGSANKIAMFNQIEADIFAESGLEAIFYSETLIGGKRPSLRYMVTFDDEADQAKDWQSFRDNPRWNKAKTNPKWSKGGVSGRTTNYLKPLKGSQL